MEKETAQALWQRLEDTYRAQEKRWSRLSLAFGLSKLVLLVTFFLTVYFIGRAGASAWSGALAAAQAVLFVAACVVQHRLNVRMRFARAMAELAEKNGTRLTGGWRSFRDTGEELAGPEHEYARDLDIVGPESLFQFLNATGTAFGRARFAADLLHPDYTAEEIACRQEAVSELAGKPEFCCRLELLARRKGFCARRSTWRTARVSPSAGRRGPVLPSRAPCAARCWRRPRSSAGCGPPRGA